MAVQSLEQWILFSNHVILNKPSSGSGPNRKDFFCYFNNLIAIIMGEENSNLDSHGKGIQKKMSMSVDFKASETLFMEKKIARGTFFFLFF